MLKSTQNLTHNITFKECHFFNQHALKENNISTFTQRVGEFFISANLYKSYSVQLCGTKANALNVNLIE